MLSKYIF